ncbi:hypothetical protein Chor_004541 [Crotalus horridus]
MMWYGVLGTKELLQRTYKNLEQKVQLECDGQYIPLPSLQGIAVLNIPSYAGGTNFWGGTKEDDCRAVKITILGDEGVPVQVDGEAWIQPPGIIKIAFESTLKSWEDKQKCDSCKPGLRSPLYPHQAVELASEEETQLESPCEELLVSAVHNLETELRKLAEIPWLCYILQMNDDEVGGIHARQA